MVVPEFGFQLSEALPYFEIPARRLSAADARSNAFT
jgi:hypothetical protein